MPEITKCPKCGSIYGILRSEVIRLDNLPEEIEVKCFGVKGRGCQQKFQLNARTGRITKK